MAQLGNLAATSACLAEAFHGPCPTQPDLVEQLQNPAANISMENHEFGLPPAHYERWPELADSFDILTTTRDRVGVEYVSTIEHRRFPFFGSQVCQLPLCDTPLGRPHRGWCAAHAVMLVQPAGMLWSWHTFVGSYSCSLHLLVLLLAIRSSTSPAACCRALAMLCPEVATLCQTVTIVSSGWRQLHMLVLA